MCTIEKIIDETPTVRSLIFSDDIMCNVLPGQFAMVWIPGVGELPMSVMIASGDNKAAFTVRRHGATSTGLYNRQVGDLVGIRGPYGNSFNIKSGKIMLVGGGTGLVPLMRLLKHIKPDHNVTVLIGAKTRDEVFFEDYAQSLLAKNPHDVVVLTDDGSYGKKGLVTDMVKEMTHTTHYDAIYTCGPEQMMYKTVQIANSKDIFVQASLERMMKCGVGICGSCCMGSDLVCKDGTIFDGNHLLSNPEFGHIYREKDGTIANY
jgi:dihydroorotate dehydrogenase electron transfer subunit